MSIICFARIPLVAPSGIAAEIDAYRATWQPHLNRAHYHGHWDVLPLRSAGGKDIPVADLLGNQTYANTLHMSHFPAVQELIHSLQCPVHSVRLLNLRAGAVIKPHRDRDLAYEHGEARLHFPIITNPNVEFLIEQTRLEMLPGQCWYINANLTHQVTNGGNTDRIHLVIDCLVNTWLAELFHSAPCQIRSEKIDHERQRQVIAALRQQNNPTAMALADQLEQEL